MIAMLCLSIISCKEKIDEETPAESKVTLDKREVTLSKGQIATISIKDAGDGQFFWNCSDNNVLLLSNNIGGSIDVEALQDGVVEVRAIRSGDLDDFDVCKVTVSTKVITKLSFSGGSTQRTITDFAIDLYYHEGIEIEPEDASNKVLSVTVDHPDIVSVEWNPELEEYKVTGLAEGEAKITYRTTDGSDKKVQTMIHVLKNRTEPTNMKVTANNKMVVGAVQVVQPVWTPADAGKCDYTVSSSDESVAWAIHNGFGGVFTIHAKKAGTTNITVESVTNHFLKETIYLTVYEDSDHTVAFNLDGLQDFIEREEGAYVDKLQLLADRQVQLPIVLGNQIDEVVWTSSSPENVNIKQQSKSFAVLQTATDNFTSQEGRNSIITVSLKDHPEVSASLGVVCYNVASGLDLRGYKGRDYYGYEELPDIKKNGMLIDSNKARSISVSATNSGRFRGLYDYELSENLNGVVSVGSTDGYNLPGRYLLRRVSKEALENPIEGTFKVTEKGSGTTAQFKLTVK